MLLVNRNLYQLLELAPVVQNSTFNPGQRNPVITLGYPGQRTFINGGVYGGAGSVSYYLDGGINMTGLRNTGNILPNPDASQEYRVETNNYDAEYGKMSSGVITVLTKSGTNAFHGALQLQLGLRFRFQDAAGVSFEAVAEQVSRLELSSFVEVQELGLTKKELL